ncbi:hypothetical protein ASG72_08545 [Bosea sp. Leaf344]|uniref:SapC family protein n=1 Tax=Bosea sp. Leaf344 TaxID=1736346 RepID=UPI0006F33238|nr:SapC family protein [Bosea sp. Leaf344]KQU51578.1 hypothetical protein ASG72_08545 [Bosea sp. Leaf344]
MSDPDRPRGLRFVPVETAGLSVWGRPPRLDCLDALGVLPVADTELLNLSHHCPIAIRLGPAGPAVVCLLGRDFVRKPLVSGEGRWLAPYWPLALRSLPFRSRLVQGRRVVEIAPELAAAAEGAALALSAEGSAGSDYAAILGMLGVLERGAARLADAARLLLAADLLIPIGEHGQERCAGLTVVSGERLGRLPPHRAAALAADRCLAFDLAAASLFSRRWLADGLILDRPEERAAPAPMPDLAMLDHGLRDAIEQPLILDNSPLFSFETYFGPRSGKAAAQTPGPGHAA